MELLRKEAGILELTVRSNCALKEPVMHTSTDYEYGLIIDPILNKPAFTLCSATEIVFSSTDFILCRSYVVFILESAAGEQITGEDLWGIALEGRDSMNLLLQDRLSHMEHPPEVVMAPLNYPREISSLNQLVLAAFRLN